MKTLFVDIGGVLLTNGWERNSREKAAEKFGLNFKDMEKKHQLVVDLFEIGKLSLNDYLDQIVFDEKRDFTPHQFKEFMFGESKPFPEMLELMGKLKERGVRIGAISNESRELTEYRIETFQLAKFISFFVSSCFVRMRKPDPDMYLLALDLAQSRRSEALYIDDREVYVKAAGKLGIEGIHHTDFLKTSEKLKLKL